MDVRPDETEISEWLKNADIFPPGESLPSDIVFTPLIKSVDFFRPLSDVGGSGRIVYDCTVLFAAKGKLSDHIDYTVLQYDEQNPLEHDVFPYGFTNNVVDPPGLTSPSPTSSISDCEDAANRIGQTAGTRDSSVTLTDGAAKAAIASSGGKRTAHVPAWPAPGEKVSRPVSPDKPLPLSPAVPVKVTAASSPVKLAVEKPVHENSNQRSLPNSPNVKKVQPVISVQSAAAHPETPTTLPPTSSNTDLQSRLPANKRSHDQINGEFRRTNSATDPTVSGQSRETSDLGDKKRRLSDNQAPSAAGEPVRLAGTSGNIGKKKRVAVGSKTRATSTTTVADSTGKSEAAAGSSRPTSSDGSRSPEFEQRPGKLTPKVRPLDPIHPYKAVNNDKLAKYVKEKAAQAASHEPRLVKSHLASAQDHGSRQVARRPPSSNRPRPVRPTPLMNFSSTSSKDSKHPQSTEPRPTSVPSKNPVESVPRDSPSSEKFVPRSVTMSTGAGPSPPVSTGQNTAARAPKTINPAGRAPEPVETQALAKEPEIPRPPPPPPKAPAVPTPRTTFPLLPPLPQPVKSPFVPSFTPVETEVSRADMVCVSFLNDDASMSQLSNCNPPGKRPYVPNHLPESASGNVLSATNMPNVPFSAASTLPFWSTSNLPPVMAPNLLPSVSPTVPPSSTSKLACTGALLGTVITAEDPRMYMYRTFARPHSPSPMNEAADMDIDDNDGDSSFLGRPLIIADSANVDKSPPSAQIGSPVSDDPDAPYSPPGFVEGMGSFSAYSALPSVEHTVPPVREDILPANLQTTTPAVESWKLPSNYTPPPPLVAKDPRPPPPPPFDQSCPPPPPCDERPRPPPPSNRLPPTSRPGGASSRNTLLDGNAMPVSKKSPDAPLHPKKQPIGPYQGSAASNGNPFATMPGRTPDSVGRPSRWDPAGPSESSVGPKKSSVKSDIIPETKAPDSPSFIPTIVNGTPVPAKPLIPPVTPRSNDLSPISANIPSSSGGLQSPVMPHANNLATGHPKTPLTSPLEIPRFMEEYYRRTSFEQHSPRSDGGSSSSDRHSKVPAQGYSTDKLYSLVLAGMLNREVTTTLQSARNGEISWKPSDATQISLLPGTVDAYIQEILTYNEQRMLQELQSPLNKFNLEDLNKPERQVDIGADPMNFDKEMVAVLVKSQTDYCSQWSFVSLVVLRVVEEDSQMRYMFAVVSQTHADLSSRSNPHQQAFYQIRLILPRKYKAILWKNRKISWTFIHSLEHFHPIMKGLLNLDQHPLAAGLAQLEPVFFLGDKQAVVSPDYLPLNIYLEDWALSNATSRSAFYNTVQALLADPLPRISIVRGAPNTGKLLFTVNLIRAVLDSKPQSKILFVVPGSEVRRTVRRIVQQWVKSTREEPKGLYYYFRQSGVVDDKGKDRDKRDPRSIWGRVKYSQHRRIMDLISENQEGARNAKNSADRKDYQDQIKRLRGELDSAEARIPTETPANVTKKFEEVTKDLTVLVTSPFTVYFKPIIFSLDGVQDRADQALHTSYFNSLASFNYVFTYHAGQMCELTSLQAISRVACQKAVFIGDPMQIPVDDAGRELPPGVLSTSFLTRVKRAFGNLPHTLNLQTLYGIPREIASFANAQFYGNNLAYDASCDIRPANAPFHAYRFLDLAEKWIQPEPGEIPDDFPVVADLMEEITARDPNRNKDCRYAILTRTESDAHALKGLGRFQELVKKMRIVIQSVATFQNRTSSIVLFYAGCDGLPEGDESPVLNDLEKRRICMASLVATESLFIIGHPISLKKNKTWERLLDDARNRADRVQIFRNTPAATIVKDKLLRDEPGRGFTRRK